MYNLTKKQIQYRYGIALQYFIKKQTLKQVTLALHILNCDELWSTYGIISSLITNNVLLQWNHMKNVTAHVYTSTKIIVVHNPS